MGSSLLKPSSSGTMSYPGTGSGLKYTRTILEQLSRLILEREECLNTDGQQGGGDPETRSYQEPHTTEGGSPYLGMGPITSNGPESCLCSGGTESFG